MIVSSSLCRIMDYLKLSLKIHNHTPDRLTRAQKICTKISYTRNHVTLACKFVRPTYKFLGRVSACKGYSSFVANSSVEAVERCRTDDLMPNVPSPKPCGLWTPKFKDWRSSSVVLSQVVLGRPKGLFQSAGGLSAAATTRWWSSSEARCLSYVRGIVEYKYVAEQEVELLRTSYEYEYCVSEGSMFCDVIGTSVTSCAHVILLTAARWLHALQFRRRRYLHR